MRSFILITLWSVVLLAGATMLGYGLFTHHYPIVFVGGLAVAVALLRIVEETFFRRRRGMLGGLPEENNRQNAPSDDSDFVRPESAADRKIDPGDSDALIGQMLDQGRYALVLRPQIAVNLDEKRFADALGDLGEAMALVPDGDIALEEGDKQRIVVVQRFFLDRYPVTNREYYEFVAAGGYRQMSLWNESILPAVLDFVDHTGEPSPKYWKHGCFLPGEEKLPVIGVCWYEAEAYARWIGKRLPNDAEWVKAGAWPVPVSNKMRVQRKYPWGDTMDRSKANLWGSGPGHPVRVDEYHTGVSVGGIYQLIGNVWEWTSSDYLGSQLEHEHIPHAGLRLETPLKSIRGGAFDTYFDNQATCQFQSGEGPLNRRHNIGFRCATGLGELMLLQPDKQIKAENASTNDRVLVET